MTYITGDPIADFARHEAEQQELIERLPTCAECGEPIMDEYCYEIEDDLVCESCLRMNHGRCTSDYI